MLTGSARIEGLEQLERAWSSAVDELSKHIASAVEKGCKAGVKAAFPRMPKKTGAMQKKTKGRLLRHTKLWARGEMRWPARYSSFMEEGTKAHDIHPKLGAEGPLRGKGGVLGGRGRETQRRRGGRDVGTSRSMLRWRGPGGRWIFARFVRHPGTTAYRFQRFAETACVHAIFQEMEDGIRVAQAIMRNARVH